MLNPFLTPKRKLRNGWWIANRSNATIRDPVGSSPDSMQGEEMAENLFSHDYPLR